MTNGMTYIHDTWDVLQEYIIATSGDGLGVYVHSRSTGALLKQIDIDASVYHVITPPYDVTPPDHSE